MEDTYLTEKRTLQMWKAVAVRCLPKFWSKHPTYSGCTLSTIFKDYGLFRNWCQQQIGFDNIDEKGKRWQLDKDLLVKGNRLYGEDTCVFLPAKVNLLLTKRDSCRGKLPLGVTKGKKEGRFRASCNDGDGNHKHLCYFDTPIEAFLAYKVYKENLIKQVAEKYKHQLDPRAYQALLNYTVEITD
jgi:hypothetical protein